MNEKSQGQSMTTGSHPGFDAEEAGKAFAALCRTIAALRHPETGCPWDLQQTHDSLRKYMIEEAYEAADAMARGDTRDIADELGDVMLQVVLNAQLGADAATFSILDVIRTLDEKMKRRHPHVFSPGGAGAKADLDDVWKNWRQIKANESKGEGKSAEGVFHEAARKTVTAAKQATKIGEIARSIRFDWDSPLHVIAQLEAEIAELREAVEGGGAREIGDELGDVYFTLAQVARHLGIDPEVAAIDGNRKFLRRFARMESLAKERGVDIRTLGTARLETLWSEARSLEKNP